MEVFSIKIQVAFDDSEKPLLYVKTINLVTGEVTKHFNVKENGIWQRLNKEATLLMLSAYDSKIEQLLSTKFERGKAKNKK